MRVGGDAEGGAVADVGLVLLVDGEDELAAEDVLGELTVLAHPCYLGGGSPCRHTQKSASSFPGTSWGVRINNKQRTIRPTRKATDPNKQASAKVVWLIR